MSKEREGYSFCLSETARSGSICFSLDLTGNGMLGRSMAWFDFRIENGHGIADFFEPVNLDINRPNRACALYVAEELRRSGVGTALILRAKEILKDHGVKDLLIRGVRQDGQETGFYQTLNPIWLNLRSGETCKYGQSEIVTVGEILLNI